MADFEHWPDVFFLAGLDIDKKRCRLLGWASVDEVRAAPIVDYGYGNRYSCDTNLLHKELIT